MYGEGETAGGVELVSFDGANVGFRFQALR